MFHEAEFQRIRFADLRAGDVLVDIPNAVVVVDTSEPLPLSDNLAFLAVAAFTADGTEIGNHERVLSIVDEREAVRLVALRGCRHWRPPPSLDDPSQLLPTLLPSTDTAEAALDFVDGVLGAAGRAIDDPAERAILTDLTAFRIDGDEYLRRLDRLDRRRAVQRHWTRIKDLLTRSGGRDVPRGGSAAHPVRAAEDR